MSSAPETDTIWTKRRVPAWGLSCAMHAGLLIAFAFAMRHAYDRGVSEVDRPVGIVLVRQTDTRREYEMSDESVVRQDGRVKASSLASALPDVDDARIDLSSVLPAAPAANLFGAGDVESASIPDLTAHGLVSTGDLGKATTSVFGVSGTGNRFVYVFDRSASMKGRPLAAAKKQLIDSLMSLGDVHQFQIIFYNEKPKFFADGNRTAKMVFADERGKRRGADFVEAIAAVGGTRHMPAISLAINLRPDVIFFLTDADEPQLTEFELKKIRRMNRGATIHAIQFGAGPQSTPDNFLQRLARQNGGQHAYVDVTLLQRQ